MNMRRLRNIVAAALLLIVIVSLFALHQSEFLETYQFRRPYGSSRHDGNNSTVPEQTPTSPNDGGVLNSPSQSELEPSSQDTLLPENIPLSSDPPALGAVPEPEPSSDLQLPPVFEAEFPFQRDLELDLPIETFKEFSNYKPHNYEPNGPKINAYATFMATRNPSLKDPYFMGIHSLIYRILWSPRSRTEKYPFVVFVGDFVTAEQRELLSGAGAIVRELAPLEWNPNVPGIQHRWKDLFAKLNMWNQTEFSRILFLDADAFPVVNIDSMFDISPVQNCLDFKLQPDDYLADGTQLCEPYVFSGVPQDPFNEKDVNINVGSMVFAPSEKMHQRLLQNYVKTDRYNCLMAEQAFLNWQFNVNGAFPATMLERKYGGFFPSEDEEGELKVVHEKLWSEDRSWLKQEWVTQWQEMLTFYNGTEFSAERERDGSVF